MKNFKFYEDEIKAIVNDGKSVAIRNNKPVACWDIKCEQCDCNCNDKANMGCHAKFIKWLYQEHVELTEEEHALCVALKDGYIARGRSGRLVLFTDKPTKNEELGAWVTNAIRTSILYHFPHLKFNFIKWEDEEPYSIDKLIKAAVKTSEREEEQHE